ncbi:transglutaminase family protein [Amaricoccus sp.]|uniref:transglutaminase-like domain-containing protein n=1 Tax=Amaricoccus sp. TaxID=1872485 RepID=UPI001B6DEAA6|nr:transglutaminase family protein [Amaricoccus sp.]MBP7003362.1 transglutaminase family protein [Amaricoccus sp.]
MRLSPRLAYELPQRAPMIGLLNVHFSRFGDLGHTAFGYEHARATRTAADEERIGVRRGFTRAAVAFCRCMNIPARSCTGYVSEIGQPKPQATGDLAAWIEVCLGGAWHTSDPRNNARRTGRTRSRNAADMALTYPFGPALLVGFEVRTDPI